MKKRLKSLLLLFALVATTVCASPPQLVNYQGRLTDSGGAPVNAIVPIVVRIYAQASGGTPAWEQTLGDVAVSNGLYSFQFGDGDLAESLTNSPCWLELVVDGETLAPRQPLVSVPYALKAEVAETALTSQSGDADTLGGRSLADIVALITPPGMTVPFSGTSAPSGWLLCDGTAVSRSTYAALFSAVGITYGTGDGSTTFNLPDLRGRVAAGKDDMGGAAANRLTNAVAGATLGAVGGAQTHTLTTAEMPAHNHQVAQDDSCGWLPSSGTPNSAVRGATFCATGTFSDRGGAPTTSSTFIKSTGGSIAHNNVQPTIILNYIIKY